MEPNPNTDLHHNYSGRYSRVERDLRLGSVGREIRLFDQWRNYLERLADSRLHRYVGSQNVETLTAANVQFNQDSPDQNKIKFQIADVAGSVVESPAFTVKIDGTPRRSI